jgi:hypothetical protein
LAILSWNVVLCPSMAEPFMGFDGFKRIERSEAPLALPPAFFKAATSA